MRRYLTCAMLLVVTASSIAACGCNKNEAASGDDSKMRSGMSNKTFDINNVPPEQRDRVRGFMQQSQSGTVPGASPAAPAGAAAKP